MNSLKDALKSIEDEFNISIVYNSKLIEGKLVSEKSGLQKNSLSLDEKLEKLLSDFDLRHVKAEEDFYIIIRKKSADINHIKSVDQDLSGLSGKGKMNRFESWVSKSLSKIISSDDDDTPGSKGDKHVSGTVLAEENKEPIPGVNVMIKGTGKGTVTDVEGHYDLDIPEQGAVLVFSFLGYGTREIPISNESIVDIVMPLDNKILREVVVVGYGEQSRSTVTGSIASIDAKSIENIPMLGPDQLMQGRAPGVEVRTNSGEPGGGIVVRVRGATSISGSSDPLYVIDGIPVQSNSLSDARILGARPTNPLADINPADIESIEVLKDASATAIYGARAANGVVLITTKRGSGVQDKVKINFDMFHGFQEPWRKLPSVSGPDYERLLNEYSVNNGGVPQFPNPDEAITTNWQDFVWNTGAVNNYNLSFQGGNEKVQFFLSGGKTYQEGILKGQDFDRNSVRANLDFMATSRLKLGTSLMLSQSMRNRVFDGGVIGAVVTAKVYPPNEPLYQPDGSITRLNQYENPYLVIRESDAQMKNTRFLGNLTAKYEFSEALSFQSNMSVDYSNVRERQYFSTALIGGAAREGWGKVAGAEDDNWIFENLLSYRKNFGDHAINGLFGLSYQESILTRQYAEGQRFPSNQFREIASAAVQLSSSDQTSWGIASVFSRVDYQFRNKYLATVNLRRDGSSRFGEANRWGTFPSMALGWRVSEEAFLQGNKTLSDLKIRASYGVTGNQNGIGDFQAMGLWIGGANYVDDPGTRPSQLANPDLRWESTYQLDIGLDMGLFGGKLNVVLDYYDKVTKDLLLAVPIPATTGFQTLVQNYGSIGNRGVEFGVMGDVVRNREFTWNMNFNIARNQNKILNIAAPFNTGNLSIFRIEEGYPLFSFYAHEQLGVDPQTGDPIWTVLDAERNFNPNLDRKVVGDANPTFFGGFTNSLYYKNFDFMFFFQFVYGNRMFNQTRMYQEHGGTTRENFLATQLDRWQQPGDITMVPRMTLQNYASNLRPSRFIEDASFLRLKNISLGYNLPMNIINPIGVSKMRIYVAAQNLWTLTNYTGLDPELSGNMTNPLAQGVDLNTTPQPRLYMAGVNLSF
ncbi:MAG: TonB-dependent receptor [Cyclobacteriaceae bacterium]|nr:TonB-dependent receptor [Cyclobacteriaceae bacterium]